MVTIYMKSKNITIMKRNFILRRRSQDYMKFTIASESGQQKMKKIVYKITLCVVFICSLFTLQSQAQQVRIFNTENSGLPHNWVTAIAIDAHGNKWFGTVNGEVVKYDNVNWTVYNSSNSGLDGLSVTTIAIDQQDNKWIGTENYVFPEPGELIKFNNTTWTVYNSSNSGLPYSSISAIAIDSLGNKWIGTLEGGIAKFDDTNWTVYLPSSSIYAVETDIWGNKWVATSEAILKFNDIKWTEYKYSKSIIPYYNGNGGITSIAIDGDGIKWFGIWEDFDSGANGGVTKFDDVNWTTYSDNNSDLPYSVHSIAIDKQGNKWFGCSSWSVGALVKFDGSNWTIYNNSNSGFPNDWIESIAIDDMGNKWIATGNSGVVLFNENGITTGLSDKISVSPEDFTIYPNPAKDFISIDGLQAGTYEIINIAGAILKNSEVQGMQVKIDISQLPKGVYTMRVTKKDNVVTKKFIKN
jgi:ligand-binding sensor domain-containing protein